MKSRSSDWTPGFTSVPHPLLHSSYRARKGVEGREKTRTVRLGWGGVEGLQHPPEREYLFCRPREAARRTTNTRFSSKGASEECKRGWGTDVKWGQLRADEQTYQTYVDLFRDGCTDIFASVSADVVMSEFSPLLRESQFRYVFNNEGWNYEEIVLALAGRLGFDVNKIDAALNRDGNWRGGIRGEAASGMIVMLGDWLLLQRMRPLIPQYSQFFFMRPDMLWIVPPPPNVLLGEDAVWVPEAPDGGDGGGLNDRARVCPQRFAEACLSRLLWFFKNPDVVGGGWNTEIYLQNFLAAEKIPVRRYPNTAFLTGYPGVATRWSDVAWNEERQVYAKIGSEVKSAFITAETLVQDEADWFDVFDGEGISQCTCNKMEARQRGPGRVANSSVVIEKVKAIMMKTRREKGAEEEAKKAEEEAKKAEEEAKKAEEEAKKKAEEEAKKKAEEEAKKNAEEEAKKNAEEEAKKREEEAKKKAEEEAKKKAEEEAKKKAEEEAKKKAEGGTRNFGG